MRDTATDVMLKIAFTKDFKRDVKKLTVHQVLSPEFAEVMYHLHRGKPLPAKYKDHALSGDMQGYRDCHIFNDLVLIYQIVGDVLKLIRISTHSDIF